MLSYYSVSELVEKATKEKKNISDIVIEDQAMQLEKSINEIYESMLENLKVMKQAVEKGENSKEISPSGLSGGSAFKMKEACEQGKLLSGTFNGKVLSKALAIAEVNACMGKIVAAPTAGSCGILPSVILTLQEEKNISDDKVAMSLFTSAGIGMVIAKKASISGAEGGCQAECGSASAMTAAAIVELAGGTPQMAAHACAIAFKSILGLVCDPVAGLVEVPCIKRNATGAMNALVSAELALAGIESTIPVDEVIEAMKSIGDGMSPLLKETGMGGLAATPTGKKIRQSILAED